MANDEYLPGDEELFEMLGRKKPTGKQTVGVVVSVKRARELEFVEELIFQCRDLIPIAGWVGATLVFATATVFGWMHPIFGSVVASLTFAYSAYRFWRWRRW